MKLFDRLIMSGFEAAVTAPDDLKKKMRGLSRQWMAELQKAMPVIFLIDNVANYYFEDGTRDNWDITKNDFPCLAPPWPLVFMEYVAPSRIVCRSRTDDFNAERMGRRFGILLDSAECGATNHSFHGLSEFDLLPGHPEDMVREPIEGIRWLQQASVFAELDKERIVLAGTFLWFIDAEGRFNFPVKDYGGCCFLPPFGANLDDEYRQELGHNCWCFTNPALLAISFIHCRNTKLIDNHPPTALVKASMRRHGIRPVTFKTLEIEPVKKILQAHGNATQNGLRMALHICRGHFKDYRQSSGLFGKHKDLYWWDQHVRGHLDQGIVIKDYVAPKKDVQ